MNGSFTKLAIKNVFIIGSILKYHFIQENGFPKGFSSSSFSSHPKSSATNLDIHSLHSLPRHSPASSSPGVPQSPPAQHTLPPPGLPKFPPSQAYPSSSPAQAYPLVPPLPRRTPVPSTLVVSIKRAGAFLWSLSGSLTYNHAAQAETPPGAAFRTERSFSVVPGGGQDPSINPGDPVGSRIQNFLDFRSSKFR